MPGGYLRTVTPIRGRATLAQIMQEIEAPLLLAEGPTSHSSWPPHRTTTSPPVVAVGNQSTTAGTKAARYCADVGGDPSRGADPIAMVIEGLLRLAQESALAEDWITVKDRAQRVLNSGAASQDAERQAKQFLLLADLDSTSPRVGGLAAQSPNVEIAGERRPERSPLAESGRPAADSFSSDKATLNVPNTMLRLFYSYVDADAEYRRKLRASLAGFRNSSSFHIEEWDREMVQFGEDRNEIGERELKRADIILLLISPDYLAQGDADDAEIARSLLRAARGEARVVPIMLKATYLPEDSDLRKLRPLPPDGLAVTQWPDQDLAFSKIAEGIKQVCDDLAGETRPSRLSATGNASKNQALSADVQP